MTSKHTVQITQNFERNLEALEAFLIKAEAAHAFDASLDELMGTVIPNLERFPGMGRLNQQLDSIARDTELYEDAMKQCLLLYARHQDSIHLLSIRHQKQQPVDFQPM